MQNLLRLTIPLLSLSLFVAVGCSPSTPTPSATPPVPVASAPATTPATTSPSPSPVTSAPATPSVTPSTDGKAKPKNGWDEIYVKAFMDSCVKASNNVPYCECSINKVQEQFTPEEFAKISRSITPGKELPAEMMKIVTACKA
jgi:hypothetical protein